MQMAVMVVKGFKTIHIHHQHPHGALAAQGQGAHLLQALMKMGAVGNAQQAIGAGHGAQAGHGRLQLLGALHHPVFKGLIGLGQLHVLCGYGRVQLANQAQQRLGAIVMKLGFKLIGIGRANAFMNRRNLPRHGLVNAQNMQAQPRG